MTDLNLSAWIERRASDIGPYAEHILKSVKEYEAEIKKLRSPRCAECDCDAPPKGCNWIKWDGGEVDDLNQLLREAVARVERMTPEEREAMDKAQLASWARGMTQGCEHGVLDFEQCLNCRGPKDVE